MSGSREWIVTYSLSKRIPYDVLNPSPGIRFITENSFLIGFEIVFRGLSQVEIEKESRLIVNKIQELIIIESGMAIKTNQTSIVGAGVVQVSSIQRYDIEGKIGKLDLNEPIIQKLLKSTPNKDLKFLSDAILLRYYGFNEYSIRESIKITENAGKTEERFQVLRNAFSHSTLGILV